MAGVDLDIPPFTEGLTNATPAYLRLNPDGAFPLLVAADGTAHAAAAAALKALLGTSPAAAKWADWAAGLDAFLPGWVDGIVGTAEYDAGKAAAASGSFRSYVGGLEAELAGRAVSYGTLGAGAAADAAVAMSLFPFYVTVMDDKVGRGGGTKQ